MNQTVFMALRHTFARAYQSTMGMGSKADWYACNVLIQKEYDDQ